jgi:hypothetical protein
MDWLERVSLRSVVAFFQSEFYARLRVRRNRGGRVATARADILSTHRVTGKADFGSQGSRSGTC